jgi:hypothetical protein
MRHRLSLPTKPWMPSERSADPMANGDVRSWQILLQKSAIAMVRLRRRFSDPKRTSRPRLLDHLVGAGKKRAGNGEAHTLCRLAVNHKLEDGRLLDRQFGWLCAAQ